MRVDIIQGGGYTALTRSGDIGAVRKWEYPLSGSPIRQESGINVDAADARILPGGVDRFASRGYLKVARVWRAWRPHYPKTRRGFV